MSTFTDAGKGFASVANPCVNFTEAAPSYRVTKIFNGWINIYVTPDSFFATKFREIFKETKLRHTTAAESRKYLACPNMKYSSQQLNFAVSAPTKAV